MAHPKESGHWYAVEPFMEHKAGDQVGLVPNAKADKMIKPDIRHARKFNLAPGVTTILKQLAKPGLEKWKGNQLLESFATLPEIKGESLESRIARVREDADAQAKESAEWGTEFHKWFQNFIEKSVGPTYRPAPEKWGPWIAATWEAISPYADFGYWVAEESFVYTGYGGKVDLYCPGWVIDIKTREWDDKPPTAYFDNAMQLAAYEIGLSGRDRRIANVLVNRKRPEVIVQEWSVEDQWRAWSCFSHLVGLWQITNKMPSGSDSAGGTA